MRVYPLRSEQVVQQIAALFAGFDLCSVHLVTISDRAPWRSTTPWLLDGLLHAAAQQECTTLAFSCVHRVRGGPHGLARLAARRGITLAVPDASHTVTLLLTAAAAPPPRVAFDMAFVDATTVQSIPSGQPIIAGDLIVTRAIDRVSALRSLPTAPSFAIIRRSAHLELADWLAHTSWGRLYRKYQQALFAIGARQECVHL